VLENTDGWLRHWPMAKPLEDKERSGL